MIAGGEVVGQVGRWEEVGRRGGWGQVGAGGQVEASGELGAGGELGASPYVMGCDQMGWEWTGRDGTGKERKGQ